MELQEGMSLNLGSKTSVIRHRSFVCLGSDAWLTLSFRPCRLPYNDLSAQLTEPQFRPCLQKTLEVLYDLLCTYQRMITWQHPKVIREPYSHLASAFCGLGLFLF